MRIYFLQKLNKILKIRFLKNFVFWLLHILNRRYLSIYFDPVLACNLRCKSCYFSNDEKRKELKGVFKLEEVNLIASAIFSRAFRLQIGCGAEPTLFKHNPELIQLGKKYGIKYISMTSNVNLLTRESTKNLLEAGLNELTISIHGVKKETYENLMTNASYDKLLNVLQILSEFKPEFPHFKLRLNFTINNQNVDELKNFFEVFGKYNIDILQMRALRNISGEIRSVDTNKDFLLAFNRAMSTLKAECKIRKITFLEPDKFLAEDEENIDSENASYCYISPKSIWESDFKWRNETFNQYSKRTKYSSKLFKVIFKK